jgi:hypothetical protein
VIYNGTCKLLKSFGLGDLLMPNELGRVRRSVWHVRFSERAPKRKAVAWPEDDDFAFRGRGGRTLRIALVNPIILGARWSRADPIPLS